MISWEGKRISWRVKGLVKGNVWSKGKKKRWRWWGSRSGFRIWYCAWPRYPWPCASEPYLSGGQTSAQTDHGKHLWPEKDLSGGGGIHKGGNIDSMYLWEPVGTSIIQTFTNSIKYTVWGLLPVTAGCTNHCLYQARASCLYQHQDAHRCHWYWLAFNRVMSEIYDTLANERTPGWAPVRRKTKSGDKKPDSTNSRILAYWLVLDSVLSECHFFFGYWENTRLSTCTVKS